MSVTIQHPDSSRKYKSYIVGFVLSVVITIASYLMVVYKLWPMQMLIFIIIVLAVLQLIVQLLFFLHVGEERGTKWKLITFSFAGLVVLIVVIGSLWIMYNLDYNMMHMTPEQQNLYMQQNEGI